MNDDRQIDLLAQVLDRTADLLDGAAAHPTATPTPCPDMDLGALVDHVVTWAQVFAGGATGEPYQGDPFAFHVELVDAAAAYRAVAHRIVDGWRTHGLDRDVEGFSGTSPGRMSFGMTLMEEIAHGWDVATATGQDTDYPGEAIELALSAAHEYLLPEHRGPESFGEIVPVPDDAPPIDRYLGFMGRRPHPVA